MTPDVGTLAGETWPEVEAYVEAYEAARAGNDAARVEDHLPPPDHPDRLTILCELVRVALEHDTAGGGPPDADAYRRRFPELFADAECARLVSFEADRLRRQAPEPGDAPPEEPSRSVLRAARTYRSARVRLGGDGADALGATLAAAGVGRGAAELFCSLHAADPGAADRLAGAVTRLPHVGGSFLGFRLEEELGRGAFGRVFLARQAALADRVVALKVAADVGAEANALAQLRHTNVVPIYSVHRDGPLRAVCMPFLGVTTLADVLADIRRQRTLPDSGEGLVSSLRDATLPGPVATPEGRLALPTPQVEELRRLNYVPAVLWLARRMAEGLAHAHERGILHRDLKPANVLLAADGEPVLLDFNLAADTKRPAPEARLGGTLPYMAPEHLEALDEGARAVDERSDVYSLGVILFELLTGRAPYPIPTGSTREVVAAMLADRRKPPPDVRQANPAASPAVAAIVARCLRPDPAARYASARELAEDLRRQLEDLPLKHTPEPSPRERTAKWLRRHPRLTSTSAVATLAGLLVTAVVLGAWSRQRYFDRVEALSALHGLEAALDDAAPLLGLRAAGPPQLAEGIARCRAAAGRYGVPESDSWGDGPLARALSPADRALLRSRMGELLFFWAGAEARLARLAPGEVRATHPTVERLNALARSSFGDAAPRAAWLQAAELAEAAGRPSEAANARRRAAEVPVTTPRDHLLLVADQLDPALDAGAAVAVRRVAEGSAGAFFPWLLLGDRYARLGRLDEAEGAWEVALALRPDHYWAPFLRGTLALDRKEYATAEGAFDRVVALRPDLAAGWINRALARLGRGNAAGAEADLTRSLDLPGAPTRAWLIRAQARARLGDDEGARRDLAEGLRRRPDDVSSWVARGVARVAADPDGALSDFDAALRLDPDARDALMNRSSVLAEKPGRTTEAIGALDRLLVAHPNFAPALAGRGVLHARLGHRDVALADARAALAADPTSPAIAYQVAGIYARTSGLEPADAQEALRLLGEALRRDPSWIDVIPRDPELDTIRDRPEFRELVRAATVVGRSGSTGD